MILAIGRYDKNWYFNNTTSYHIIFDLANFEGLKLIKCKYSQNNITLANELKKISDGIGTIPLLFYINRQTEKISLFDIYYYSQLDTKLISFGIPDRKRLTYTSYHKISNV